MVRTLAALGLACAACTLIVDHELSKHPPDAGAPDAGDAGDAGETADAGDAGDAGETSDAGDAGDASCPEAPFVDGAFLDGGGPVFHSGVDRVRFHGPGFPAVNVSDVQPFRSTVTFFVNGALELGGGFGDDVGIRYEENFHPSVAVQTGAHAGPNSVGCAEILAGTDDPTHSQTFWQLIPGGCDDATIFQDGGTTAGHPTDSIAAVGFAPDSDAGGYFSVALGPAPAPAAECFEFYPLGCFPPGGGVGPPAPTIAGQGFPSIDGFIAADGGTRWAVTGPTSVSVFAGDFTSPVIAVSGAAATLSTTLLAADVSMSASIDTGHFIAQSYRGDGEPVTSWNVDLGDTGAHGLNIAHFPDDGTRVHAAWIGGDGVARAAIFDVATPTVTPAVQVVCGSQGATLAAPMTAVRTLIQVGDALYLRPP